MTLFIFGWLILVDDNQTKEQPLVKERFHQEEVSIEDLSLNEGIVNDKFCEEIEIHFEKDDFIILEFELEKVRIFLKKKRMFQ